jgi:hypothetical protein
MDELAMIHNKKILYEHERGQSLVEFAVSAIIILMLLVAIADFGRAFFTYLAMRDAAQEGAVYGSVCPQNVTNIIGRIENTSSTPVNLSGTAIRVECEYHYIDPSIENVSCSDATSIPEPGDGITIRVIYDEFTITTPLLGSLLGSQHLALRAEVTDTILRVPPSSEVSCQ